jgi:hypothetical protein
MPNTLISFAPTESQGQVADEIRMRALDRLYERLNVVDALIQSMEAYQRTSYVRKAKCIPFNAARRCS